MYPAERKITPAVARRVCRVEPPAAKCSRYDKRDCAAGPDACRAAVRAQRYKVVNMLFLLIRESPVHMSPSIYVVFFAADRCGMTLPGAMLATPSRGDD